MILSHSEVLYLETLSRPKIAKEILPLLSRNSWLSTSCVTIQFSAATMPAHNDSALLGAMLAGGACRMSKQQQQETWSAVCRSKGQQGIDAFACCCLAARNSFPGRRLIACRVTACHQIWQHQHQRKDLASTWHVVGAVKHAALTLLLLCLGVDQVGDQAYRRQRCEKSSNARYSLIENSSMHLDAVLASRQAADRGMVFSLLCACV